MTMRYYAAHNGSLPNVQNSSASAVITRLKAALVTGYGDKPAAGWELLYESLNNPDDPANRLAVRSKDVAGDRMVFHFSEVVNGLDVQMARDWDSVNHKPIDVSVSGKWQKQLGGGNPADRLNTGSLGVIADSKSCWVSVGYCLQFFGTFDYINPMQPKDIILFGTHYDYLDNEEHILPQRYVAESSRRKFNDQFLGSYVVESPANKRYWFNGGSVPRLLREGDVPYIQKIKIWHNPVARPSGENWYYAGHIPGLVFSPCKITTGDKVVIDGNEKTLIQFDSYGTYNQVFMVDEA